MKGWSRSSRDRGQLRGASGAGRDFETATTLGTDNVISDRSLCRHAFHQTFVCPLLRAGLDVADGSSDVYLRYSSKRNATRSASFLKLLRP